MQNYQCRGKNYQCPAEGETDNYLTETLIILHITKTESNNCFIFCTFQAKKTKTKSNNCFIIIDFKPEKMARIKQ